MKSAIGGKANWVYVAGSAKANKNNSSDRGIPLIHNTVNLCRSNILLCAFIDATPSSPKLLNRNSLNASELFLKVSLA